MDVAPPQQPAKNPQMSPGAYGVGGFGDSSPEQNPAVQNDQPQMPKADKPKKNMKKLLIIAFVALIVFVVIAIAVVLYLQSSSSDSTDEAQVAETSEASQTDGRVNAEEVEATIQELDSELNSVSDSEDFSQNDLTNDQIGL